MEVINAAMRKGIKTMCIVAQTAQFVSLMPKPEDFVTRIVGDVVYLSSSIKTLSDKMNKLLDEYAEIPGNYLMTQMNSISGSLSRITNRVDTYTKNAVNQGLGLAENTAGTITELTGLTIDSAGAVTSAVVGLTSAAAQGGMNLVGNKALAESINDGASVVLEWVDNGFKTVSEESTASLKNITQNIKDLSGNINSKVNKATETVKNAQKQVETLITDLREKMNKLSALVDTNFKDVTGMSSVSKGADIISKELTVEDDASRLVIASTSAISEVIKNFNIGKVVLAFSGVITQSMIVRLGLDSLPPIDFESMLCKIRDDMKRSPEDLYAEYAKLSDSVYNDVVKLKEEKDGPSENRKYSAENYNKFIDEYNDTLSKKRKDIREMMKKATDKDFRKQLDPDVIDSLSKKEIKSAIKELENYRKKVKNAKQADTLKDILGKELDNVKKEAEYRCNSLKSDWNSAKQQYKKAIDEIKRFFSDGGSSDQFIDDCCDRINADFNAIKDLCKGLTKQLIGCGIKIAMPSDIGPVFPNPGYKIPDFWEDINTIFAFIKDVISKIVDIINNINKIARIMINGINNIREIINQLTKMLNLQWLMKMIQNIIDLFGNNIKNSGKILANTLSPVYFEDTNEYENAMTALENISSNEKVSADDKKSITTVVDIMSKLPKTDSVRDALNDVYSLKGKITKDKDKDKVDAAIEKLEDEADTIVAYKSPIIVDVSETEVTVNDLMNGGTLNSDIKFIGWYFFHPNLEHTTYYSNTVFGKILKKLKNKIIKKAAKTANKNNGGIAGMTSKEKGGKGRWKVGTDSAYDAFYWYTYYTEDIDKDCFEWVTQNGNQDYIYVDNIVQTENGSIVEVEGLGKVFVADTSIRSGDYVNVNGRKYRVK